MAAVCMSQYDTQLSAVRVRTVGTINYACMESAPTSPVSWRGLWWRAQALLVYRNAAIQRPRGGGFLLHINASCGSKSRHHQHTAQPSFAGATPHSSVTLRCEATRTSFIGTLAVLAKFWFPAARATCSFAAYKPAHAAWIHAASL